MFHCSFAFTGQRRLKELFEKVEKESPATMTPQSTTSLAENLAGISDLASSNKFPSIIPYLYQPWANFQGANLPYFFHWSQWAQQRSVPLNIYEPTETSSDETISNAKT